jgi:glycine/D-amino acid oxidase-like deaminating enzyme
MSRTRYGISPWVDEFPQRRRPDFPRFRGTVTVPVAIVGGGLAGCLTAYAFAAAGVKVVLVEGERLAMAGASRGPGVLQSEAASSYRELDERLGRKASRAMFEASRRAVLDLATTARRLGIKQVETHDAVRVLAAYGADEKAHAREVNARRDAGLDAVPLKPLAAARESGIDGARGGVRLHDWGRVDPYRLVLTFARAAADRGALIFERSVVRRIKTRRRDVDVQLEGGNVVAETVVVCTGEPTDLFRSLKRHLRYEERYLALTERLPATTRRQIGVTTRVVVDTDAPPHLVRWTDDDRLVIAGADQKRTPPRVRNKVLVQRTGQLMYELSRLYPAVSGVLPSHGWDLPVATTADGAMYAGPHRNFPRHLFAWGTRHDPAQAFLASRILLRHFLGTSDRDDGYFAFTRG